MFVIVFKIISLTGRPTSSCFQFISLAGRFAESYSVTLLPFSIISVVDHLAPSCYLVELFSRLIATLRVLLFVADKTSVGENCFVEVQYLTWFLSLIARLRVVLVPGFKTFSLPSELFCRSTRIAPLSGLRAILSALGSKIVFRGNQSSFLQFSKISFVDAFSGIRGATD